MPSRIRHGFSRRALAAVEGVPIEPLVLCNAGVEAALWLEDAAQLPAGLTFDPTDGTIACIGHTTV